MEVKLRELQEQGKVIKVEEFMGESFSIAMLFVPEANKYRIIVKTLLETREHEADQYEEAYKIFLNLKEELSEKEKKLLRERELRAKSSTKLAKELYDAIRTHNVILLYGPTGTGKTETTLAVAERLKEEGKIDDYLLFTMASGMDDLDLLGKFIPQSDRSLKFIPSPFLIATEMAKEGLKILIVLDEFNRATPKTLNILLPLFDKKGDKYRLNNFITGEIIEIPAQNIKFILTANFGGSYSGTYQVDPALLNRMEYVLFVDYQSDVEEKIIASSPNPEKAKEVVEFFRELAKAGEIKPFTTRDVKFVASLPEITYEKMLPVIYKLVNTDNLGYPDEDTLKTIKEFFEKLS